MKTIKLHVPGGLDNLTLTEKPDPGAPGPGEIRVAVKASSLNFHDYAVASGMIPTANGRIPMADAGGVVEAIGDGVSLFAPGDHVVSCFFPQWMNGPPGMADFSAVPGDGMDGFAREIVVAPETSFTRAPEDWSHAEASTITTAGLTAWRALVVDGGLKAGDTVLTLGTGGVSIYALQIAKAMGARVISTSSSDAKIERLKALGADDTINYVTTPEWGKAVEDLTSGRGVDHVIEVGGPGTLAQSIDAARIGGHISLIGVLTGMAGPVPTGTFMLKQQHLKGVAVGSRANQLDMVRGMETTGIRPIIDKTFPLEKITDAFRYEESRQHFGKICLSI